MAGGFVVQVTLPVRWAHTDGRRDAGVFDSANAIRDTLRRIEEPTSISADWSAGESQLAVA